MDGYPLDCYDYLSTYGANNKGSCTYYVIAGRGGSLQMITVLHRGAGQMIRVLHRGGPANDYSIM